MRKTSIRLADQGYSDQLGGDRVLDSQALFQPVPAALPDCPERGREVKGR
jgi:hypothetical protein